MAVFWIELLRQWPTRRVVLYPGSYRVPTDISQEMFAKMEKGGAAVMIDKRGRPVGGANAPKTLIERPASEYDAVKPIFDGKSVLVVASGPSLTEEVAGRCRELQSDGLGLIVCQDAYKLLPSAEVLYGCDAHWWRLHNGVQDFAGERWSTQTNDPRRAHNDKRAIRADYDVRVIEGRAGNGLELSGDFIYYGNNSGFQTLGLAVAMGARRNLVLIGFDMRIVRGQRHFFGDHPEPLRNAPDYKPFTEPFDAIADKLPGGMQIFNATPYSALKCFRKVNLNAIVAAPA